MRPDTPRFRFSRQADLHRIDDDGGTSSTSRLGIMADYDARLIDLYDVDNPDGADHDLYRALADEVDARSIVDLGCGTGSLTVSLAGRERHVLGVDPSVTMLNYARSRPGAASVHWVNGDSGGIDVRDADYAVMTGNVAQHILGDAWPRTLADLRQALRPGGVLAFESRNPEARAWESWKLDDRTVRDTPHGPLTEWAEVSDLNGNGEVTLAFHNVFEDTGDHVVENLTLAFRDRERITRALVAAGFDVEIVWGSWIRKPFQEADPVMIFKARRQ
ncbi:SAM-dependent methyltransferase [Arthrobacter pigmenti]|uniref:SAM-dependent methyltransferase n=1 Tax=Arthrobacter pigmenti TaxID=271432 RepID=A0A846RK05_9MICC|nr:SAM-dependent methyltransferase [Arthrobacter pigmenti]